MLFSIVRRSSVVKNIIRLVSGTALAQALLIISTPVITRMYSPEAFGISGYFVSIANLLIAVGALCLPMAMVLPKGKMKVHRIAFCSINLSIFVSILALITGLILFDLKTLNIPFSPYFVLAIPLVIVTGALIQVSEKYLQLSNQFNYLAICFFLQVSVGICFRIVVGSFINTYEVLILSFVFATMLHATLLTLTANKKKLLLRTTLSVKQFYLILVEFKDFIFYRCPQTLSFFLTQGIPVLIISHFYPITYAGYYTLSVTVLSAPAKLISKAVGDVLLPKLSVMASEGLDIYLYLIKVSVCLFLVGVFPLIFFFLFSGEIFELIFGLEWREAGEITKWLSFLFFVGFINVPAVQAIIIFRMQKGFFFFSIIVTGIKITGLFLGAKLGVSIIEFIQIHSFLGSISGLLVILYVLFRSKSKTRSCLR